MNLHDTPVRLIAFDLSLTASGYVSPSGEADTLKPPKGLVGPARLDWWGQTFEVILADAKPTRIVVEQPYVGHRNNTLKLGELYGVFNRCVHRATPTPVTTWVPPSTLKKAWTGQGNSPKEAMSRSATFRGFDVKGLDDNAVDALALWHLCREGVLG